MPAPILAGLGAAGIAAAVGKGAATVGLSAAGGVASYYIVDAARAKHDPMTGQAILTTARNIGGVFENQKTPAQGGYVYTPISSDEQRESMLWLHKNVFNTPKWLTDTSILQNIEHTGYFEFVRRIQARQLNQLIGVETLGRLINSETMDGNHYSVHMMLKDLREGIWSEAYKNKNVDVYRRNLQNTYVNQLINLLLKEYDASYDVETSDIKALARGELKMLATLLKRAKNSNVDVMTKYHYENAIAQIEETFSNE